MQIRTANAAPVQFRGGRTAKMVEANDMRLRPSSLPIQGWNPQLDVIVKLIS